VRHKLVLLIAVLALVGAACGDDDDDPTAATTTTTVEGPTVRIMSPTDGTSVKGNVVVLDLETDAVEIVKADGDTSGESGHFHVFIDKEPVAPGATIEKVPGIVHSTENPLRLTGLTPGKHTFVVVLGDGAHQRIGSAQDSVEVTVEGPSLDATAPPTVAAGQPLSIDVTVDGVELVKPDGDTSGRTGHLHVFIDKEPTPGAPIPAGDPTIIHSATAPITVNGLAAGEHTIWVVLGDGTHVPFDPAVADRLTVTVT
jgi:hypothetical protein